MSYHAVLDSVVVIDKGSQVSTKNLVYDAETGEVVINRTNNEFNLPIYTTNYPAYWAYSGMGTAYKNIDAVYKGVNFLDGRPVNAAGVYLDLSDLESGDEIYVIPSTGGGDFCYGKLESSSAIRKLWVYNNHKNAAGLTDATPDLYFIDEKGRPYTKMNVSLRIVRSGKRNLLSASIASMVTMEPPYQTINGIRALAFTNTSKVVNTSALEYQEKWQIDNDVIRKVNTAMNSQCVLEEFEDCNGYLEKKINPYVKGLMGNFKSFRNLVYYGERTESDPLAATAIYKNGFLKNFGPYWNFNSSNNAVPNTVNSGWQWNSKVERINAKGLELETSNALGIFTAAQYGYRKTMPIALTSNARSEESFYEGFEDDQYNEAINHVQYNGCSYKFIDFKGLAGSQVVAADAAGINAHTGRYVLAVDPNTTVVKDFAVKSQPAANTYNAVLTPQVTRFPDGVFQIGANVDNLVYNAYSNQDPAIPQFTYSFMPNYDMMNVEIVQDVHTETVNGVRGYYNAYTFTGYQYFNIAQGGNYTLNIQKTSNRWHAVVGNSFARITKFRVYNDQNDLVYSYGEDFDLVIPYPTNLYSINLCLPKGIYKTEFECKRIALEQSAPLSNVNQVRDRYNIYFTEGIIGYQSITPIDCNNSKPIAANADQFNPAFAIPANKKMVFSAWVKEPCGDLPNGVPCTKNVFTGNQVLLQFNNGSSQDVTLQPTGSIIEGWQRYEGYFTAPTGDGFAKLKLTNNTGTPIYFDDIRIHPFNANMKSYVYDPVNLRLTSELDANNYATFYEYDEEGTLIRVKAETREGIKTIKETRSAKQTVLSTIQ